MTQADRYSSRQGSITREMAPTRRLVEISAFPLVTVVSLAYLASIILLTQLIAAINTADRGFVSTPMELPMTALSQMVFLSA